MQNNTVDTDNLTTMLVGDLIKEKRSERLWKNIRFFIGVFLILLILVLLFGKSTGPTMIGSGDKGYVSFIRLEGAISPDRDFSAATVIPLLKQAFEDDNAKGVVLVIDSGGGTPVQAAIIHDAIVNFKKKYHKMVIVVGEDLLASGAYYVAVGADKIYVNPNTITGSIGVVMKSFGFPDLIKKYGIERRVFIAGVNKDRLDPFMPQNPEDAAKIHSVINEVHDNFIAAVVEGRKGKLHADTKLLFSGDFWSGKTALNLGLVDGLGNLQDVLQNEFHVTRYKDYSQTQSIVKQLAGQFGTSLAWQLKNSVNMQVLATIN